MENAWWESDWYIEWKALAKRDYLDKRPCPPLKYVVEPVVSLDDTDWKEFRKFGCVTELKCAPLETGVW